MFSGSVLLQIGQRSMKRLWRQKVGILRRTDIPVCARSCAATGAAAGHSAVARSIRRASLRRADAGADVLRRTLGAFVGVAVTREAAVFRSKRGAF